MDRLWAPWRKAYIRPDRKSRGCVFCRLFRQKPDSRTYILKRTPFNFAVLNLYPYNNGHVMIVPNRHLASLKQLKPHEKLDWFSLCEEVMAAVQSGLKAQGVNLGMNFGKIAGAGIPGHLHLHIVPRWKGDANFMPVVGGTKVISESLDSVYELLTRILKGAPQKMKGSGCRKNVRR